ncbi:MAG: type VI secretion protein [Rhizobiales bacterium 65-79]|jgi:type VI secretion system protein ImpI|nr:type VI secretion system-associated FHA domain protein TagH [Hyphomicrobiales bacterium]OJU02197.1 MAG: type VI secretion protein [Rhizobiales bacterium 65-79]
MFISLKVENPENLPQGSRVDYAASQGAFEIGRQGSDWTLPDPERIVSSRHCRIEYQDGAYWLHDLSRNGTFVNGSRTRLEAPYRLRSGDRLRIGRYTIRVTLDEAASVDQADARRSPMTDRGSHTSGSPAVANASAGSGSSFSFDDDPFLARPGRGGGELRPGPAQAPPTPARAASAPQPASSARVAQSNDLLRQIAAAAGMSPDVLLQRDPREVASEMGIVLRLVAEQLATLLKARAAAKGMVKSPHRTILGGADNNPLKFVPSTEEVLEIMFGRRRPGYMDAARSVEDAFRDLKTHEIATYAAMQTALARLLEDISPHTIEKKLAPSSFMSKKARAWDALLSAWAAREEVHENGMLDVFLSYFSEAYADASKER